MPHCRTTEATRAATEIRRIARRYLKRMKQKGYIPPQAAVFVRCEASQPTPSINCSIAGPQAWIGGTDRWTLSAEFIREQVESIRVREVSGDWRGGTAVKGAAAVPARVERVVAPELPAAEPPAAKPSMIFGDLAVNDEVLMAMEHRTASDGRPLPILRRFTCTRFTRRVEGEDGFADYYGIRRDFFETEEIHLGRYRTTDPVIALRANGGEG